MNYSACWRSKKALASTRCHTFNTQANRVVIICSVITRIFNPMKCWTVTFQPLSIDTRDYLCLLIIACSHLLLFDYYLILCSISFSACFNVHFIVNPVKYSVLILECIPGILIPTTTFIKRVNKHHTSDCTVFVLV
jgi:hypothetical protein